jgi:hypothetical protein
MSAWTRQTGASLRCWTMGEGEARVRVKRVNRNGVPAFRAYFPDGKQFTAGSEDEAKEYAERYVALEAAKKEGKK